MRKLSAGIIGLCLVLSGCTTEPEGSASFTYKKKIYIPPLNREFCNKPSAVVYETRAELYDPALPSTSEPCIYPYPEPELWESYELRHTTIPEYTFNPTTPGDSAQKASFFFHSDSMQSDLVARFVNNGQVTRYHYTVWQDSVQRGPKAVFYNREFGGFQIGGQTAALEIYIIK